VSVSFQNQQWTLKALRAREACQLVRRAAFLIADIAGESPKLTKLTSELSTMASVTEIMAYAVKDGEV
jgi:hypothetical protein